MKRIKSALMSVCMLAAVLLAAFMPAGAAMAAADYSFIRVLLSTPHNTDPIKIAVKGSYTIKEKPDYVVTAGDYIVKLSGSTVQLEKDGVTTSIGTKCTFVPANYTSTSNMITLKSNSRRYVGDVFFYKNKFKKNDGSIVDKLHMVNRVPMEYYVYGVVGPEIGANSHMEALKAQAVAARGYAINQLAPGEPNYEVGDTSKYQVYHGYDGNARVIQAVDATRGQVVSYNGKICNTFFGASNGGQTELPGNAFGGGSSKNAQYPYLAQKNDPYDIGNTASKEQIFLIPKQIDSVTGDVVVVDSGRTKVRIRSAENSNIILTTVDGGASFPYVGETGDWYIILYDGKNAYISKQFTSKQNNGGSGNFPYVYKGSQLNALQKAVYNALGSSNVSSQNNVQLVSVQSITNGTEQWPGTGSRCYATATAVVNVRYLNNSGNVITKDGVKCTLTLLNKSDGKYTYSHDFFDSTLRMRSVEEVKSGGQVTGWNLVARRFGHGVGLSQRGAQQRARDDQSYQEILAFYYDKTQLITVNTGAGVVVDNDPPEASEENLKVNGGDIVNAKKFTARLTGATDSVSGIGKVQFAVWSRTNGQDDLRWYDAKNEGNGTYSVEVDIANHLNQTGEYHIDVYLYDNAGNLKVVHKAFPTDIDATLPTVTEFEAGPTPTESKFTIRAKVEDDKSGVERVQFAVWCSKGGQDDLKWYDAKDEGDGIYTYEVNIADHKNQAGPYYIHVYTWDKAGNSGCSLEKNAAVQVTGDVTPPTISEMKLVGDSPVNAKSFDVQVAAKDSGGIDSVTLRVLNQTTGIGESIEYVAKHTSGDMYQGSIQLLDYLNANGTYEIQATVKDKAGNKATETTQIEVAYEYNKKGTIKGTGVNVRTQPNVSGEKLGQVNTGDTFTVLDEVETQDSYGKWIAIDYNGKLGYVVATYVTVVDLGGTPPSEPTGPPAEAQEWVLIIKTNVNIRSGPSTKTQSLGMANKGDKFEYLGEENGWYALTYNGQKAYVRQDMAEVVKE